MSYSTTSTLDLARRHASRAMPARPNVNGLQPFLLKDDSGAAYEYGFRKPRPQFLRNEDSVVLQRDNTAGPMDDDRYTLAVHRLKAMMSTMLEPRRELGVCDA